MTKGPMRVSISRAPLSVWAGKLAGIAKTGTEGYPGLVRRRLMAVNVMAFLIATFSLLYVVLFAVYDAEAYLSLIVVNLLLAALAILAPLAHRFGDVAAALIIAVAEYIALFFFVRALGHDSGIQLNYIIAAAVPFAIFGRSRIWLVLATIIAGLALHIATWFL